MSWTPPQSRRRGCVGTSWLPPANLPSRAGDRGDHEQAVCHARVDGALRRLVNQPVACECRWLVLRNVESSEAGSRERTRPLLWTYERTFQEPSPLPQELGRPSDAQVRRDCRCRPVVFVACRSSYGVPAEGGDEEDASLRDRTPCRWSSRSRSTPTTKGSISRRVVTLGVPIGLPENATTARQ
jgi:hypothetical protein